MADLRLEMNVVLECTGAASVIAEVLDGTGRNGIVCLAGGGPAGRQGAGYGDLRQVAAVVLETDGTLNVIASSKRGDGWALGDVQAL